MPKISAHMPVRNNAKFVAAAIKSVLAEPFADLELLVFDDASDDGSREEIERALDGRPKAKTLRSEVNLGAAKAFQSMLDQSDSEYVLPVGGDDLLIPGALEERMSFLDSNRDFAGAYGKLRHIDESGADLKAVMGLPFSRFNLPYETMICHGGNLLRRSDVVAAGGYIETGEGPKSVAVDLSLWFRLALFRDFKFFDRFVYLYRQHPKQMTRERNSRYEAAQKGVMEMALEARKDISGPLMSGGLLDLKPGDAKAAILILGILSRCVEPDSLILTSILETALKLAPDDYGVLFRLQSLRRRQREFGKALEICDALLKKFGSSHFLRMTFLKLKRDALLEAGIDFDREEIESQIRAASAAYCEIPQGLFSAPHPSAS